MSASTPNLDRGDSISDVRRSVLVRALEVAAGLEVADLGELFTDDVKGWSPNLAVSSREELETEYADRDDALSDVVIAFFGINVMGAKATVEWVIEANHTGPLLVDDVTIEPTGRRVVLAGATFAEFDGKRIAAFRNYFDDAALFEQLFALD